MHRHCLRSTLTHSAEAIRWKPPCNLRHISLSHAESSTWLQPDKILTTEEIQQEALRDKKQHPENGNVKRPKKDKDPYWRMSAKLKHDAMQYADAANAVTGELAQETSLQDEDEGAMTGFTPGTFVEIRKNERAIQALVLGEQIERQRWTVLSLTTKGQMISHYRKDVHFAIPNLISASLAERCGFDIIPTQPQIAARVEALKRLRTLSSKVDKQASGLQQRPMNVYVEVMSEDPTKWTYTTVSQVTGLLYDRPLFMDYYMTHKYLMDRPLQYVTAPGYLKNQRFAVRPRRDIHELETVEKHIHSYRDNPDIDSPFKSFVTKARTVVAAYDNDQNRKDSGHINQQPAEITWDTQEQLFLSFLLRSLQQHTSNQLDPYAMGRITIVKSVLQTSELVTDALAHGLLIKLGVIAPWQDLFEFSPTLSPWGDFKKKKTLEAEASAILQTCSKAKPGVILGPMDFLPSDPLESVRHDFGDARAFVIDDTTAEELDDAISLEHIPTEPGNYWVHTHVADLARVIHPGHALAKIAEGRFSSYYLAQKSYPLFPKALVHDPTFNLSLSEKNDGEPNRVLTFSIKVDGKANILDYKIRAGLIRNLRKVSYYDVDLALGNPIPQKSFPFGGSETPVSGAPLSEKDLADLRTLQKLAHDQVAKRFKDDLFFFTNTKSQILWNTKIPDSIQSPSMRGSTFSGFPDLTYAVYEISNDDMGARSLVSEMMKLANRVASRVALDHKVPLIRRAMEPGIMSPNALQEVLAMRSPQGYVSMHKILQRLEINPVGMYTLEPKGHYGLGVPEGEGYARATSPLRRFEDAVAHWQLHHILLGSNAPRGPPFDVADLERLATLFEAQNQTQTKLHASNTHFHSLMYIKRFADDTAKGVERPFGNPLASMRAWTRQVTKRSIVTNEGTVTVHLPDLGIHAQLDDLPSNMRNLDIGTELRVKVKGIDLGIKRTKMSVVLDQ